MAKMKNEDDEPVYFCKNCLSLNIRAVMPGISYCKECNCGQVQRSSIQKWEELYKEKYGEKFLNKKTK